MKPPGVRTAAVPAWEALRQAMSTLEAAVPCTTDPDAWTDAADDVLEYAARECWRRCPVITECSRFAIDNREVTGVWGGTNRTPKIGRPGRPRTKETA